MCGEADKKRSLEHIWPEWLLPLLRETDRVGDMSDPLGPGAPRIREWKASSPEITVGICSDCNGTLSELEAAVAPVLGPMVQGRGAYLNLRHQRLLATWAVKTVLMHQVRYGARYDSFKPQRLQLIRQPDRPPEVKSCEVV